MLKLEFSPRVTNALMKAFPRYTQQKAEKKLFKYIRTLERMMRRAKLNKSKTRANRNVYELEAKILWDKTGQLGTQKIRVHQWLIENRVPFVINTNHNHKPTRELARFRTTSLLIVKNESLLDLMRSMTSDEVVNFLDNPSVDDIEEINDYLKEFRSLPLDQQIESYDFAEVDIESVKTYLKKLADGQIDIDSLKQESDADNAEYILRIAQLNNGLLPQLKEKSDFGRTYYKSKSVQNVSKRVRIAFLGDSWEYDIKSCAASWKMSFAQEWYDSKKRRTETFLDATLGLTFFLEYKPEFYEDVINEVYFDQHHLSHEQKTKKIKEAMTSVGFGAKLTMGSWNAIDGNIKCSSLLNVFDEDKTLLHRFIDVSIVQMYNRNQSTLNKYILKKFSSDASWLAELEASRLARGVKPYSRSQMISWLFQHAETLMMDIVRDELKKLGKTVLANVHDAIVVRERLTSSELLAIEEVVKTKTCVSYFALGETEYRRCL